MIDVSPKFQTLRTARARSRIRVRGDTIIKIRDTKVPKGDVLNVARVAGVMAAKKTADIIPYCHPIPINFVGIEFELKEDEIIIYAEVKAIWNTGVEMEALTAVSCAALTVYDMLKPIDDTLEIVDIKLLEKTGGKSDFRERFETSKKAAVLVISDSTYRGEREDKSGKIIVEMLKAESIEVVEYKVLPDDVSLIEKELRIISDQKGLDLVITTGGTGLGPRDVTVEATQKVIEKVIPGVSEAIRAFGQKRTPYAMLSRAIAGIRGKTIIVNLPGSSRGAKESMEALFPGILHAYSMLVGGGHPAVKK